MTLAVIMQMRKRVGLLIGFIGVAIVLFLMMDAIQSNSQLFGGQDINAIGTVNGETLAYEAFEQRDRQVEKQYLYFQGYWQDPSFRFPTEDRAQIRNLAWNEFVVDNMLADEYRKTGIVLTDEELDNAIYSNNPRPEVRNFYQQVVDNDPSGMFMPDRMRQAVQEIRNITLEDERYVIRDFYEQLEAYLKIEMLRTKYINLYAKSIYVPTWKAQLDFERKNNAHDVRIVGLQYATVDDETAEPTDEELTAYLKKNISRYRAPETRSIEYTIFNILPSTADTLETKAFVEEKWQRILTDGRDSLFINQFSETRWRNAYIPKDEILSSMADTLFQIQNGEYVGPVLEDGKFRTFKVYDHKTLPDSVHVRHVFASLERYGNIDSAMAVVLLAEEEYQQGTPWDTLVMRHSDDRNNVTDPGDLGWLRPSDDIIPTIFKAIFEDHKPGDAFTLQTAQGAHLMEIIEVGTMQDMIRYNVMERSITAGSRTRDSIYTLASRFYTRYGTPDSFAAGIDAYGLTKRFADNQTGNEISLPGMGEPTREIFQWAFEAKENDIKLFRNYEATDNRYVVAKLARVVPENKPTVHSLREELRSKVIQEKKAQILTEKIAAASTGASSIDQVASALGEQVKQSPSVTFNAQFIEGIGVEPNLAGTAAGLPANAISSPVKGQNGVYLVQKNATNEATLPQDFSTAKNQLRAAQRSRFGTNLLEQIRMAADVSDHRYKYF